MNEAQVKKELVIRLNVIETAAKMAIKGVVEGNLSDTKKALDEIKQYHGSSMLDFNFLISLSKK